MSVVNPIKRAIAEGRATVGIRRHRGVAVVEVTKPNSCGGCRVTITPQRLQELRQQNAFIHCESCGRYLYWTA